MITAAQCGFSSAHEVNELHPGKNDCHKNSRSVGSHKLLIRPLSP